MGLLCGKCAEMMATSMMVLKWVQTRRNGPSFGIELPPMTSTDEKKWEEHRLPIQRITEYQGPKPRPRETVMALLSQESSAMLSMRGSVPLE